ncbi:MAG TPA: DUF378 domain-containing protein [Candidatus Bipolaricaulota bacterium]|nr:DUF378 domain-containing protein [Candidatus Bipolaricaulota bacterium]
MKKLSTLDWVAMVFAIIGGLNWGLVGIFKFDLVAWIFGGAGSTIARLVYVLVGLAALYLIFVSPKFAKK